MTRPEIIRIQTPADANLGDHAWRVGARSRSEATAALNAELQALHERFQTTPLQAVSSLATSNTARLHFA